MDKKQFVVLMLNFFPYILIFILVYFFIILPQKRKQKQFEDQLLNLKKGQWLKTTGGIWGRVVNTKQSSVFIDVNKGVVLEVSRDCVSQIGRPS